MLPQVYKIDISHSLFPFDYEIIDEVKGSPLNAPDVKSDVTALTAGLGRLVAVMHKNGATGAGMLDVRNILDGGPGKGLVRTWREFIFLNLDSHLEQCVRMGALTAQQSEQIEYIFQNALVSLSLNETVLLHGDLGNSNIYSDGREITAVLDWEDCMAGDPVFDIASWGTFVGNHEKLTVFLNGYREVRSLPADFEFRYWLYYIRIMLAKTVHRHRFKYDISDRIPAGQRILKGLEGLRAVIENLAG
jgi:aminoglycoside phosphotransferase (APT) family kinase protein